MHLLRGLESNSLEGTQGNKHPSALSSLPLIFYQSPPTGQTHLKTKEMGALQVSLQGGEMWKVDLEGRIENISSELLM